MTTQPQSGPRSDPATLGDDWWREGVVYQIYPRSFADADGDGTGDLPGIIDRLDYLGPAGLGVDAIWLSPIYPSPGHDVGYDVSDHSRIDPRFGSEADFDRLVGACHDRGIRVVLDLVMNHTSDEHAWFAASRAGRDGPMADHYLWCDPAGFDATGQPQPPNNWVAFFGGPGWAWVPERGQFYYHTFLPEQPELNWRSPAVEAAQWAMVRRWLDRGVDGFRLDVFNRFLKHPDLPSNPVRPDGDSPWSRQEHVHDQDQPDFPELIGRFRAILDERPGRMSVGELFYGSTEQAAAYAGDRHIVFDWSLIGTPWSAPAFAVAIDRRETAFGPARWPTVALSNHDQPRQASRLAASTGRPEDSDAIARAAAVVLLTLRGTPFLYYGEEIAMGDVDIPLDETIDPPARLAGPDFPWYDRSRCRTPMQWSAGPAAGFTTGQPWLRLAPDASSRTVEAQLADPDSVLSTYRRLLAVRRSSPALRRGNLVRLDSGDPDVLLWARAAGGETLTVAVNFAPETRSIELAPPADGVPRQRLAGSYADGAAATAGRLMLRPYEGVVLR